MKGYNVFNFNLTKLELDEESFFYIFSDSDNIW